MRRVVIATNNAHKVSEIRHALNFEGWEFMSLSEAGLTSDPSEDATTFEGNARIKAEAARAVAIETLGAPVAVLADDSGLEVDALNGAPGVYSARYAGPDATDALNNVKLLAELEEVEEGARTARFVCTLVFIDEEGHETLARGTVEGAIGFAPRGTEGFGYDPLFLPDEFEGKLTLAEVPQSKKSSISHRGNALRELKRLLENQQ
jgi:XTP/dITP diphosphohydrolase